MQILELFFNTLKFCLETNEPRPQKNRNDEKPAEDLPQTPELGHEANSSKRYSETASNTGVILRGPTLKGSCCQERA